MNALTYKPSHGGYPKPAEWDHAGCNFCQGTKRYYVALPTGSMRVFKCPAKSINDHPWAQKRK